MTSNLTEEIRIEIGKSLLLHEFKKLFSSLDPESLEKVTHSVNQKAQEAMVGNDISIRDFWNLVSSIMMGYMLKDITSRVTSQCFDWSLQDLQIAELKFTSNIVEFEGFEINRKTATEVKEFFDTHPTEQEAVKQGTLEKYPEEDTRHSDPVIALDEGEGIFVHDGNGRLMRAIILSEESLQAYVGVKNNNAKNNGWVPTACLMFLNEASKTPQSVLELIEKIKEDSENAKYELENRV